MIGQLLVNVVLHGLLIAIVAVSFSVVYRTTRIFHLAHAIMLPVGAYTYYLTGPWTGGGMLIGGVLAMVPSFLLGLGMYYLFSRQLGSTKSGVWAAMIVSLGAYVFLQNLLSLLMGDDAKSIRSWDVQPGHNVLGVRITNAQLTILFIGALIVFALTLFITRTRLGRMVNAVASNQDLAIIQGVPLDRVTALAFGIGSGIAAVAGVLIASETDASPSMGFAWLLLGVVAMIIGGIDRPIGILLGALLLSLVQHCAIWFLGSQWMEASAYVVLVLLLLWGPSGIAGVVFKKNTV